MKVLKYEQEEGNEQRTHTKKKINIKRKGGVKERLWETGRQKSLTKGREWGITKKKVRIETFRRKGRETEIVIFGAMEKKKKLLERVAKILRMQRRKERNRECETLWDREDIRKKSRLETVKNIKEERNGWKERDYED